MSFFSSNFLREGVFWETSCDPLQIMRVERTGPGLKDLMTPTSEWKSPHWKYPDPPTQNM
jgi:hypothetical protein